MGRVAVVLAAMLVVVLGAIFLTRGSRTSAPGGSTGASPSGGAASASAGVSAGASVAPSAAASASTRPSASAAASPSASSGPTPASFTIVDLKLDATADPAGQARIIKFTSDAPGTITVSLTSKTPKGTTHMCLSQGSKEVGCRDWATGTFRRTTNQSNVKWTVTVIGNGIETPVVSVKATFPSATPGVHIQHARFDGTDVPAYNGVSVAFKAAAAGSMGVVASWAGSFTHELAIANGATGTTDVSGASVPSTGIDSPSIAIDAAAYRVSLTNTNAGTGGATDLTFGLTWP